MFGDSEYDPSMAYAAASFEEQLEALGRAVEAGKVKQQAVACLRQQSECAIAAPGAVRGPLPMQLVARYHAAIKAWQCWLIPCHPAGAACGAEQRDAIWAHALLPAG